MMVCMILCYLYFIPSKKYPNEQYNIENFGVLMCPLSILIFFFFFFWTFWYTLGTSRSRTPDQKFAEKPCLCPNPHIQDIHWTFNHH